MSRDCLCRLGSQARGVSLTKDPHEVACCVIRSEHSAIVTLQIIHCVQKHKYQQTVQDKEQ